MNDGVGFKKRGAFLFLGGVAAVAIASWGVWSFYCDGGIDSARLESSVFAFGGWVYDREDQKNAGFALATAGLNDFCWENGRLSVPVDKKNEYQKALAAAGVYPKAPSESRREAIREMGAFESETKTRMRELDACAFQLERTIERFSGVEYATVGFRARREQVGLVAKNVVTASVGVACKEGCELDLDAISAITVATKHQLGVESDENISIIDLKNGKSYFGTENSVGNAASLFYFNEKERVEKYWRLKFLETFDYIKNAKISVAVDLAVSNGANLNDLNDKSKGETSATTKPTSDELLKNGNSRGDSVSKKIALASAFEKVGRPAPLAAVDASERAKGSAGFSASKSESFAKLGNPSVSRSVAAQNLAEVRSSSNSSRGRIRPASFAETPELKDLAESTNSPGLSSFSNLSNGLSPFGFSDVSNATFEIRSLVVQIAIPRGYVRRVAQSLATERDGSTENAVSDVNFADLYQTTELKILDETKRVALKMLRPLQERNGWSDDETSNWIDVSVYSDVDENDVEQTTFQNDANAEENQNADGESWRVLGNFADVSEKIAGKLESGEVLSEPTRGGASFLTKIDGASPYFWGGIAGIAGVFALTACVCSFVRRKNKKNKENFEASEFQGSASDANSKASVKANVSSNGRSNSTENRGAATMNDDRRRNGARFNDISDDLGDDLDDDLEIAAFLESARRKKTNDAAAVSSQRREALDFVARNPDRAATALNRWIKPNV